MLTGAQSADLGHGATGSALARILGLPHAAVVLGIEWDGGDAMTVTRELEGGMRQQLSLPAPALLTIQTGGNTPRYATMRMIKQARKKPVAVVDGAGVGLDQAGAVVRRLYEPPKSGRAAMIEGDAAAVAKAIAGHHSRQAGRGVMAGILVVAEHFDGLLRDVTLEMIGAAAEIKDGLGGPLAVLVIGQEHGQPRRRRQPEGVDEIVTVAQADAHFDPALYEEAVCAVAEERQVRLVLIGHTAAGMAFGPAVAARLGSGFASDVFGLTLDGG